jgi:outer membrane receptor protein involved in Fe transport
MMKTIRVSIVLVLFWMRDSAAEDPDVPNLPVVKVTGHYDNALGISDAASQGTITADLIANRPALRTAEILEFVPGMIVTQHSGDGKANQYFLRGFNLDHGTDFATYVDAIPVNMRTHAHGQGYSDLNFLIPELVQRIEYKKGTYFADEGDFASAGAAHIRLANSLPQGLASLSLGSYGYMRGVLADSFKAADGILLYGLELNRSNGPWELPGRVRKYAGEMRYSQGSPENGISITAMAYHNTWNSTDQIPLRAVEAGQLGRFGNINPTDGGSSSRYSLAYAMRQREGNRRFEFNAYLVRSSLDLFSDFTYFLSNPVQGDQFNQSERRTMGGLSAAESWTAEIGTLDMRNEIGLQARYDRLSPLGIYDTVARARQGTVREDRVRELSAGIYAENTIRWTRWLRSTVGVRYDGYRFDVASSITGDSGNTSGHIVSPKLSVVFGPWNKTEYFFNAGRGFHSNDARGTTQTRLPDGGQSTPVTPLVSTKGGELGARTEIIPGLQSSVALWRLDIDSELVFVGDAGETAPSRASRRTGVEWNNHYIVTPRLLLDLDLAISRARYTQSDPSGDHIPGSLNRVVSLGITLNELGPWYAALDLRYFGPRPLIEDNSVQSASTSLAYLRVGYKFTRNTRLNLDIFNLFDRKVSDIDYYYQSRLKGEGPDGSNDIHFHPVEPRSLRLALIHQF